MSFARQARLTSLIVAALVIASGVLAPTVLAADSTAHVVWSDVNGDMYYLSTGSSSGACWSVPDSEETVGEAGCTGITGYATASRDGCGEVSLQGTCIILNSLQDPKPLGSTSIKCTDGTIYEITDGSSGTCTAVDKTTNGGSASCSRELSSNYASASCANGCGPVSGTGRCSIK